ncbi:UDP-N-acetylglucosamine--N-acetylmuramyl-(pentapeptide) pyrophosphoryl-undecaprenol N-acetylglucosamine transferase [Arcanobacterium wilhelmae]|uniref:UDP-N-acetylglucosamine--N-acetylmuramyl-(pentapeptide) pyrophosphoryl-undecaprenol N-acetylglucosamine transferase n=1 Tax=Arcanobacterium wilhelmae TaxID=1803177 RepID=A0ABT9N965_9ACTO|nr:UDP-N-acetylglucosamine--N-acetylmuramyl-(pentapeptide) pyrophosphoryl-undecaprenol N-acetylglucosamine transferase [Arcanobacterium wilhelmae]MDP9800249.1 UDP-N-acetylglucosamine--N-acetylmuramyl-(pentapeptide) pyrophosphoryl-undecaprenol N-acetylglucosamine transferase [Arcanobacterium wilhelmae]WFN89688.1 UDP-N-acetylglucosamine--N-acetylmuramyl-(pentapeptide) pyrophosphoryl-undecaprenol N-acetylglucosamine transferase [Arcanobacterium wilhelmae]
MTSYVLAGGGTAGHVNPLLATAAAIAQEDPGAQVCAVGTPGGLEEELVPASGVDLELIERAPFPRRPNLAALKFPLAFKRAVDSAKRILRERGANVVIGFGGYASTPMYLAAKALGVPVVVHEGNASPGLANKLGARFADVVALTFDSTPLAARAGETMTIGLPLREAIQDLTDSDRGQRRTEAASKFGLDPSREILLITGGSLGAAHLNEVAVASLGAIRDRGVQVLHITGKGKADAVRAAVGDDSDYVVLEYLTTMEDAYAVADLALTRSGAGMVAELSALGIPAIFVPLPIGNGEQEKNAADVVASGGSVLVRDADFSAGIFSELLGELTPERLSEMRDQLAGVSPMDAAVELAQIAKGVAK